MYIIIDLHGAPFAQVGQNADTGQYAAAPTDQNPDFYQDSQYDRALSFLGKLRPNSVSRNIADLNVYKQNT